MIGDKFYSSEEEFKIPSRVKEALIDFKMPKDTELAVFWFENRDLLLTKYFKNRRNDEMLEFEATLRWLTPIGKACKDQLIEFLRQPNSHPFYGSATTKYRTRVRQLCLDSFKFIYNEQSYDLATFNRFLTLRFNDDKNDLSGISLSGINLHSLYLHDIDFSYASFNSCSIKYCWLSKLRFDLAVFNNSCFEGCEIQEKCSLRFTDLNDTQFSHVEFNSFFTSETITFKPVQYWYLVTCVLEAIQNTFYHDINYKNFRVFRHASFLGCDTSNLTLREDKYFKSYIDWYQYTMFQFGAGYRNKTKSQKFLHSLSVIATKSWSSYKVLGTFGLLIATIFAIAFYSMPVGSFKGYDGNFFSAFYYSVVTFTTLGYGDITPIASYAKLLVIIEVILGYITLGSFIFIIGHKVSDRY